MSQKIETTASEFPIHPYAEIHPAMGEAEYEALKADIAAHGQLESAWTYQGALLDGRHRARACRELVAAVDAKEITVNAAERVAFLPKEEQLDAMRKEQGRAARKGRSRVGNAGNEAPAAETKVSAGAKRKRRMPIPAPVCKRMGLVRLWSKPSMSGGRPVGPVVVGYRRVLE